MKTQRSLLPYILLAILLVAGSLLIWSTIERSHGATDGRQASTEPLTLIQPPDTCSYCSHNLVGMTSQQIGLFAVDYARANNYVRSGTPEILLSRSITRDQNTALGLGCLPDFATIEQPPLALVILKGDFDLNRLASGAAPPAPRTANKTEYLSFVFDLWAAEPAAWNESYTGGLFRTALNDSSLPVETSDEPTNCPPPIPISKLTLHYGQPVPGFTTPPPLPPDIQASESRTPAHEQMPTVRPTLPPPIPTVNMPSPVPTNLSK